MATLSSMNVFKQNCDEIIIDFDSTDIVKANKMISLTTRIVKKYPFVFLPDFVEDFINGVFTKHMVKKYQMRNYNDFTMVTTILNFKGKRSKDPNIDNKTINLQNKNWADQYKFLTEQSNIFTKPLKELFHANVLGALVSNAILDLEYIERFDLKKIIINSYEKYKNYIPTLSNYKIHDSFAKYLNEDIDYKLNDSINYLAEESYIISMDGDISLPAKYSRLSDSVYNLISEMQDGLSYNSLMVKLMNEFPLIRITSRVHIIDNMLDDLEKKFVIVRNRTYWKYSPDSDQLFSTENYNRKMKKMKKDLISAGRIKFFGRNIMPDQFISEIKTMETGDLDDLDDQVTRIAGLVLSDAAMLQSPRENMKKFDFMVDLTNYNFRPEQVEMMKKLDFQATSNIFHCKVMINEDITLEVLSSLRNAIPSGEQGVIFTCTKINPEILQQIKDDRTIQIIDEEGIRNWCSITPTIPCRRHSVAKSMYGDKAGTIVLVKSLNYESGLATVEIIPSRMETTLQIGCLKEIDLHVSDSDDFEEASDKYCNFLFLLSDLAADSFAKGVNTQVVDVCLTKLDLLKKLESETTRDSITHLPSGEYEIKYDKYVLFDNVYVTINFARHHIKNAFHCTCGHNLNEDHYQTLCKHLVSAFIYFSSEGPDRNTNERHIEILTMKMLEYKEQNLKKMANAIYDVVKPESQMLFKEYLQKYANMD